MKKTVVFLVLITIIVCVGVLHPFLKPEESAKDYVALIETALSRADNESLRASEDMEIGDFRAARGGNLKVKSHLLEANRLFQEGENMLSEPERVKYRTILELYGTSYELSTKALDWMQALTELKRKEIIDAESALITLPEMEIFAESSRRLADNLSKLLTELDFAIRISPAVKEWFDLRVKRWDLGVGTMEEHINTLRESVLAIEDVALVIDDEVQFTIAYFNLAYIPIDKRMIPKIIEVPPIPSEIIPLDLSSFFDGFDFDRNGVLDIGEAKAFFYWVEVNITYRYDAELYPGAILGTLVGDGRPWFEYWQTPYETWSERMGDCEDMAILQMAFYNHFGISAYMATVSTESNRVVNHAIAVVLMGGSPEEFINLLGALVYYEIDGKYYMLVDNAYSEAFGYLSHGLKKGAFAMKPYINGQFLFNLEEAFNMHRDIRETL
jgi:hypothetical protein